MVLGGMLLGGDLRPGSPAVAMEPAPSTSDERPSESPDLPARSNAESPTISHASTGRIGGQVLGVDGLPAAHAEIILAGSGVWPPRATETDAEGRFVLEHVPPGIYEVQARSHAGVAPPRRGLVIDTGDRAYLSFHFTRGHSLRGQVIDAETERAIANAEISVMQEELGVAPRITRTGNQGHFEVFGLLGTTHRVTVHAAGYVPIVATEGIPGQKLHLAMQAGAVLRGVVLDERRRPVEGARLEVIGDTTDHQPIAMSRESLAFRADVFRQHEQSLGALEVIAGEVPPIPLVPSGIDTEGAHTAPALGSLRRGFTTGPDGLFEIEAVPPGYVQVLVQAAGYAPGNSERVWLAPGQERDRISIVLATSGRILGEIVDDTGTPVSAALIEHRSDAAPSPRITTSDSEGHFTLEDVIGAITVRVMPAGRAPVQVRVDLDPGEEEHLRIVLPSVGPTISGRVIDERRHPVALAELRIESMAPGDTPLRTVQSDDRGRFELHDAPRGPWRVFADHSDYARSEPIDFDTPTADLEITLRTGLDITGHIVDVNHGEAIEGARVVLEGMTPPFLVRETTSDIEGHFAFARSLPGRSRVRVEAAGYVSTARELHVQGRHAFEMEAIELTPGATLEGDVVDALGQVVRAARITIEGEHRTVTTDARGHFVLDRLAEGSWMIHADHPAAGAVSRMIRVRRNRDPAPVILRLPQRDDATREIHTRALRHGVAAEVDEIEGTVRIVTIASGARAASVGLREGDVLHAVDGVSVESAAHAAQLLRGADEISAMLDLERDGEPFRLRIPRETW